MQIVTHFAAASSTQPPVPPVSFSVPVLLLPPPPKRLALPAPKIAGYLPAPQSVQPKRLVTAEIANPLHLIDRRENFDAWWAEFERIAGRVKTIEEMNAELEAKRPGIIEYLKRGVA